MKKTKFTAELQLLMCIQNAHGCVFLISITGGKYMLRTQDLNGIQLYLYYVLLLLHRYISLRYYIHVYVLRFTEALIITTRVLLFTCIYVSTFQYPRAFLQDPIPAWSYSNNQHLHSIGACLGALGKDQRCVV